MFGLLKVLAAIFYVIEDITFKTRHDTCRGSKKKKKKKGGSLCTKSKGGGTGLNTACSDSHGFRLVKSIDRVDTSSSSSFALEIRPIQNLNEFHTLLIDLKSSEQDFPRTKYPFFLGFLFRWKSDLAFLPRFFETEKKSISSNSWRNWNVRSARIEE